MRDIRAMDLLETLSVALGLAALAGVNLYLTVFAAGLAGFLFMLCSSALR